MDYDQWVGEVSSMIVDFYMYWYLEVFFKCVVEIGWFELVKVCIQVNDLLVCVDEMDLVGVDWQVLSFVGLNVEMVEEFVVIELVCLLNDFYCDVCDCYFGCFDQFVKVLLFWVDVGIVEVVCGIDEFGVVGVVLFCFYSGYVFDDFVFDVFWVEFDVCGVIVFIYLVGEDLCGYWGME